MDKLAEWIGPEAGAGGDGTTDEFNKFLEERASATDTPRK